MKKFLIPGLVIVFILVISLVIFRTCSKNENLPAKILDPVTELGNFINANIELNCLMEKDTELKNNASALDIKMTEIYKKYSLPVDDNETMLFLLSKYEHDPETTAIIKSYTEKCEKGKPMEFYKNP